MNLLSGRGQPCPRESSPRNSRTRLSALLSVAGSWPQLTSNFWRCSLPMNQRNIQHRTPNAEHRMASRILAHFGVRCSMFDVGRSMFFLHSGASMRDQNSEDSLLEESVRVRGAPSALAASHCHSVAILDAKSESRVPSA